MMKRPWYTKAVETWIKNYLSFYFEVSKNFESILGQIFA
jgi:hypothetical protein